MIIHQVLEMWEEPVRGVENFSIRVTVKILIEDLGIFGTRALPQGISCG